MKQISSIRYTGIRQFFLFGLTALFLSMLTVLVLQQCDGITGFRDRLVFFAAVMVLDGVFLTVCSIYSWRTGASFIPLICAITVLIGISASYLLLFNSFMKQMCLMVLGMAIGIAVFYTWRRKNLLTDRGFRKLIIAIVVLLVVNVVFGQEENGARLRIDLFGLFTFQPGEVVKVLLVLLGACSYGNQQRSILYCLAALGSCVVLLLLRDMGGAVVIFAMFVLMTYLLFDNRILSLTIIGLALVGFICLIKVSPYAANRLDAWTRVMEKENTWQQRNFIKAVLYGGFRGLGVHNAFMSGLDLENAGMLVDIYAISSDGALAGIMAVYGVPMVFLAVGAYTVLILQPVYNRSVYPSNFLITTQTSMLLFCQVVLNFCGSLDLLPFTGLAVPLLSQGGTAVLTFAAMMGLEAAALHPALHMDKNKEVALHAR